MKEIARALQGTVAYLGPAHAALLGQYPGRPADYRRWPNARRPHAMVPAPVEPQRAQAGHPDERARGASRVRRFHAVAQRRARIRSARSSTARSTDRRENCACASTGRRGATARPLPAILYFHGGGWVIGSLEAYDKVCRYFAARTGCAVVAVDYRLGARASVSRRHRRCGRRLPLARGRGAALGIDPARIVLAGDSAGGTIAAVVAQQVRGDATPPCLQWLVYPVTDLAFDSRSFISFGERFLSPKPTWNGCAPTI